LKFDAFWRLVLFKWNGAFCPKRRRFMLKKKKTRTVSFWTTLFLFLLPPERAAGEERKVLFFFGLSLTPHACQNWPPMHPHDGKKPREPRPASPTHWPANPVPWQGSKALLPRRCYRAAIGTPPLPFCPINTPPQRQHAGGGEGKIGGEAERINKEKKRRGTNRREENGPKRKEPGKT